MAFWNKPQEVPQPAPTAPTAPKTTASSTFVDPDDFFKDMGRRPKAAPRDETTVASPEITGLREAPPPDPEIILAGLNTDAVQTDGLVDKAALDDGHYHGFMDDI